MENYNVKVIMDFNDEICRVKRVKDEVFKCTKERFEYLNGGNEKKYVVVELIGIDKPVEIVEKVVEKTKRGRKKKEE